MEYSFSHTGIADGVEFCKASANGFNTFLLTVSFVLPLGEKASLYALVPNVLTRSSEKYPSLQSIEKKLALLYGAEVAADVSKSGENQIIKFEISSVDDRFALDGDAIMKDCSELLFELIFRPLLENGAFKTDVVESEKRLLCERLDAEIADKRIYARRRCEAEMFSGEAYGINRFGTKEAINEATASTVYGAYLEMLKTAPVFICLSGNGDDDFIKGLVGKYLSSVVRDVRGNKTVFIEKADKEKYVKETQDINQGKLVMGFRLGMTSPDDNYAAYRVMVDLFGGSPHSKLFTVVREKMSLCYYCSAGMISQKGVMFVTSGIESENEGIAKKAILDQLEALKNGDFSDDEVSYSKKALEDTFKGISDSPEALDSFFMSQIVNNNFKYPEEYIKDFNAVTREQIIDAAGKVTLDTVFMLEGTNENEGGDTDE